MDFGIWLVYLGVVGALIAFPGPSALLCMSHGMKYGRAKSTATVLGGAFAALILMSLSALGLGAILAASETAFLAIKLVGAAYLIYLGVCAWRDTSGPLETQKSTVATHAKVSIIHLFQKGFMVGISNPKDLLFFAALFPNFIDVSQPQSSQFLILGITWFILDCSLMFLYACVGKQISPWFANARNMKIFNRTTGSMFIAAGGALAASSK